MHYPSIWSCWWPGTDHAALGMLLHFPPASDSESFKGRGPFSLLYLQHKIIQKLSDCWVTTKFIIQSRKLWVWESILLQWDTKTVSINQDYPDLYESWELYSRLSNIGWINKITQIKTFIGLAYYLLIAEFGCLSVEIVFSMKTLDNMNHLTKCWRYLFQIYSLHPSSTKKIMIFMESEHSINICFELN